MIIFISQMVQTIQAQVKWFVQGTLVVREGVNHGQNLPLVNQSTQFTMPSVLNNNTTLYRLTSLVRIQISEWTGEKNHRSKT